MACCFRSKYRGFQGPTSSENWHTTDAVAKVTQQIVEYGPHRDKQMAKRLVIDEDFELAKKTTLSYYHVLVGAAQEYEKVKGGPLCLSPCRYTRIIALLKKNTKLYEPLKEEARERLRKENGLSNDTGVPSSVVGRLLTSTDATTPANTLKMKVVEEWYKGRTISEIKFENKFQKERLMAMEAAACKYKARLENLVEGYNSQRKRWNIIAKYRNYKKILNENTWDIDSASRKPFELKEILTFDEYAQLSSVSAKKDWKPVNGEGKNKGRVLAGDGDKANDNNNRCHLIYREDFIE